VRLGTDPKVIAPIDIPLHKVALTLREERVEAVILSNLGSLRIRPLLMFLVVTVL
jgi:hypothetical protein